MAYSSSSSFSVFSSPFSLKIKTKIIKKRYYYKVTVPGEAETRTGSFKTAPATLATASPAAVTRMLLVADGGQARVDGEMMKRRGGDLVLREKKER